MGSQQQSMSANRLNILDTMVDRYFLSESEKGDARSIIRELGIEPGISKLGALLDLKPKEDPKHQAILNDMNVARFVEAMAKELLLPIDKICKTEKGKRASKYVGQLIQFSGLDIWDAIKQSQPKFLDDFLVGIKRHHVRHKVKAQDFFKHMGAGYFYTLSEEFNSAQQAPSPMGFSGPPPIPEEDDFRRIDFNKKHDVGRRLERFCNLLTVDYGYVRDIRTIKTFFNADYQMGAMVKCKGDKRNHIALLFARLIEEEILVSSGGKGHWPVLEKCFVDEKQDSLSKSFSKLLSKLNANQDKKEAVFAEVEELIKELKK